MKYDKFVRNEHCYIISGKEKLQIKDSNEVKYSIRNLTDKPKELTT